VCVFQTKHELLLFSYFFFLVFVAFGFLSAAAAGNFLGLILWQYKRDD